MQFTKTIIIINHKLEHVHMFAVAVNAHWNLDVHLSYQNVFSRETLTKISPYRLNSDRKNKIEREKRVWERESENRTKSTIVSLHASFHLALQQHEQFYTAYSKMQSDRPIYGSWHSGFCCIHVCILS